MIDYSYYLNKIALARLHDLQLRCGLPLTKEEDYKPYGNGNEVRYNPYHDPRNGRFSSGKSLDNSGEYDIIKSRSGDVSAEYQRYGRNKETLINNTYIESGEYRRKFDRLTDNAEVNKTLYACAKEALKHRSGTELEDMYWIDGESGKILLSVTDSTEERAITYTERIKKALVGFKGNDSIVTIHTHPNSMPPSISDFNSCYLNGYSKGIVACHDGKVFEYSSLGVASETLFNLYMNEFIALGQGEYDAQMNALNEIKKNGLIFFKEVI